MTTTTKKSPQKKRKGLPEISYNRIRTLTDYQRITDEASTKVFIYMNAIRAISAGVKVGKDKVGLCQLKGANVSVMLDKRDWRNSLERAIDFFSKMEYYETCQKCQDLLEQIKP